MSRFGRLYASCLLAPLSLLLIQISLARQSPTTTGEVPETSPVTHGSDYPFIPPWPYPKVSDLGESRFGSDRLWIALSKDGTRHRSVQRQDYCNS